MAATLAKTRAFDSAVLRSNAMKPSASEAMAALAEGDRDAFESVYRALHPIVSRFCARTLGEEEGRDAAQEVLLRLFNQATAYRRETPVEAWALTLARFECRTRLQRRRRNREDSGGTEAAAEAVDLDRRLLQAAAVETLEHLRPADREAIQLALRDETPVGATHRKRKQRAFERLRAAWRQRHGT